MPGARLRGLPATSRLPKVAPDRLEASSRALVRDMNRAGLTTFGVAGCERTVLDILQGWKAQNRLDVRVFCIGGASAGSPEQVERSLPQIAAMKLFQGDHYIDDVVFGESVYTPLHDRMFAVKSDPPPEQLAEWPSSWAKRLAFGRPRPVFRVEARCCGQGLARSG